MLQLAGQSQQIQEEIPPLVTQPQAAQPRKIKILRNEDQEQPYQIKIRVNVTTEQQLTMEIQSDWNQTFNVFINGLLAQIFQTRTQDQYEELMVYFLDNRDFIEQSDTRTLKELGFQDNCTFNVRLKTKGG